MAAIASTEDTVDLVVKIGNTELGGEAAARVIDVSVTRLLGQAAQLTLRVAAWDADTDELSWVDEPLFAPGATIEVQLGYLDHRELVFHGDIVALDLECSVTERAVLTISAYDVLHRLGRGERSDQYLRKTYAGVVGDIAHRIYRLPVDAPEHPDADPEHACVQQQHQSDLAFILELAGKIGYEVFAEGSTIVFRKSRRGESAQLILDAGRDLIQLTAHLAAASQLGGVTVKGLDSATKQVIEVTEDNPDAADQLFGTAKTRAMIVEGPCTTQAQATARARAALAEMRSGFLDATGTCLGRTDLKPGMVIELANAGKRFQRPCYVTSVTYSMTATGGLRTSFKLEGQP